jgi:phosphopentomutase
MGAFGHIVIVVLNSVGIGARPDAGAYGDVGREILGHIAELASPNLARFGTRRGPPQPMLLDLL